MLFSGWLFALFNVFVLAMLALDIGLLPEVHIATLRRPPVWPYLAPVPEEKLYEIAHRVEEAGFRAKVFPTRWTGKSGRTHQDQAEPILGCG